jgi:regulation of enolase protein 1 (concanavalin A-like superfamily)
MMQLFLIILTKKKRNGLLLHMVRIRWQKTSTNVSIVLTKVCVPAENGYNISIMDFSLTSPYNGLFTNIPLVVFSLTSSYM